jgi:hypothetical protein
VKLRALLLLWAVIAAGSWGRALPAQDPGRVAGRVTSQGASGTVVIDRGQRDRLEIGDLVQLLTRAGARLRGTVVQVEERSAVVELADRGAVVEPGTRIEVVIPSSRLAPPAEAPPLPPTPPERLEQPEPQARPRWTNRDPDYQEGQPLLTGARAVRPEEREPTLHGRAYAGGSLVHTPGDSFRESFLRVGTELQVDNPFRMGGGLFFQGELNYKNEVNDNAGIDLLVQRASYAFGGTRFSESRWEVGRFLQFGMPELGVLDGVEWGQRSKDGHRYGATIGFIPDLDDDFDTGKDLQFALYYNWVADDSERFLIGGGYQKSLHHGDNDRDLLVLKTHYLPDDGWIFDANAFVDFYYGRDDLKSGSVDLTQALATARRTFEDNSGVELTYRRIRFPEMQRSEFVRPLPEDIRRDRLDRLGVDAWTLWGDDKRLHGHLSGFNDHDDSGGAAELGVDVADLFVDRSQTDVTAFGEVAQFSDTAGVRASMGVFVEDGRWDFFYEFSYNKLDHLPVDSDDLLQHRARVSRSYFTDDGWDLSIHGEVDFWDDQVSWFGGCQVQKTF